MYTMDNKYNQNIHIMELEDNISMIQCFMNNASSHLLKKRCVDMKYDIEDLSFAFAGLNIEYWETYLITGSQAYDEFIDDELSNNIGIDWISQHDLSNQQKADWINCFQSQNDWSLLQNNYGNVLLVREKNKYRILTIKELSNIRDTIFTSCVKYLMLTVTTNRKHHLLSAKEYEVSMQKIGELWRKNSK